MCLLGPRVALVSRGTRSLARQGLRLHSCVSATPVSTVLLDTTRLESIALNLAAQLSQRTLASGVKKDAEGVVVIEHALLH